MSEGNLPSWPGASAVYSYLYSALEKQGLDAYKAQRAKSKSKKFKFSPPEEMNDIIDALNRGDEEILKAYQMEYKLKECR